MNKLLAYDNGRLRFYVNPETEQVSIEEFRINFRSSDFHKEWYPTDVRFSLTDIKKVLDKVSH